jgi:hypothetical protein
MTPGCAITRRRRSVVSRSFAEHWKMLADRPPPAPSVPMTVLSFPKVSPTSGQRLDLEASLT